MTNRNARANPQGAPHVWSSQELLEKADLYMNEMLSYPHDDWKFALWSTLCLELLARAALSRVSPVLLADTRPNWNNLAYSIGIYPAAPNFVPRAIDISEVFRRLRELNPQFTVELEGFSIGHMARRNEELHSGATPFADSKVTSWLPTYYRACAVLLESMGHSLDQFLGPSEAPAATIMIKAATDKSAQSVRKSVEAHKQVWEGKSDAEKEQLRRHAASQLTYSSSTVVCPACGSKAVISGDPIAPAVRSIDGDTIEERQEYLPSKFKCVACSLKIAGLSHLGAAGLGDPYNTIYRQDLNDYYAEMGEDFASEYYQE